MEIKSTVEWLNLKKKITSSFGKDMEELELFCNAGMNANWDNHFAEAFGRFVVKYAVTV